jgi:hypothetical protein
MCIYTYVAKRLLSVCRGPRSILLRSGDHGAEDAAQLLGVFFGQRAKNSRLCCGC